MESLDNISQVAQTSTRGNSGIERTTGAAAAFLASRMSRRSFLGRVTKYSVASVAGAAGAGILVNPALATLTCDFSFTCDSGCAGDRRPPCGAGRSITCLGYTGSNCPSTGGTGGTCPNCSTACGSWHFSCPSCPSGIKTFTDCCATCDQCSAASSCVCKCDIDGVQRAHCCFKHCWKGGQSGCNYVVCRTQNCS